MSDDPVRVVLVDGEMMKRYAGVFSRDMCNDCVSGVLFRRFCRSCDVL